jgi:hypothetical protein
VAKDGNLEAGMPEDAPYRRTTMVEALPVIPADAHRGRSGHDPLVAPSTVWKIAQLAPKGL